MCEQPSFIVEQRIVYHTGFYAHEQGQRDRTWWPNDKHGVVVEVREMDCLIEFPDKTREWAPKEKLSQE
jgi:hypothetical protein